MIFAPCSRYQDALSFTTFFFIKIRKFDLKREDIKIKFKKEIIGNKHLMKQWVGNNFRFKTDSDKLYFQLSLLRFSITSPRLNFYRISRKQGFVVFRVPERFFFLVDLAVQKFKMLFFRTSRCELNNVITFKASRGLLYDSQLTRLILKTAKSIHSRV